MPESVSPAPISQTCRLTRHRRSAGTARQKLHDFLLPHPSGELLLPTGELLVSELVTNAIQHCRAPRDRHILVRFHLAPDHTLRIEVHDADSEKPVIQPISNSSETGRGLFLVQELAQSWGCCPREGGIGKFVWCHISPEAAAA
ncbi:ATP-binding protein [Kitasatospora brasiliensis]|uniref:ATP-binding protein n=1 Tax=Kitasatospora brasiliensis TaxID=3058040 RepID=UPI00292F2A6D|nr:ATP-binding protein [Kitasatospora sp. K002]